MTKETLRLKTFASFFKRFMGVSTIVTAALPIPVTAFKLIPTYSFQTKALSVYTSLFCFLTFAFIFYNRHSLARVMFPEFYGSFDRRPWWNILVRLLPLGMIGMSLFLVFQYQAVLDNSIIQKRVAFGLSSSEVPDTKILEVSDGSQTPQATILMIYYLLVFITAETAFVLIALKEYLQDLLKLTEVELISGKRAAAAKGGDTDAGQSV